MNQSTATRPVSVGELRRAWHALQDGQFRPRPQRSAQPLPRPGAGTMARWSPTEPVLPVLGCVGQAGATTLAVALATVAGSARVLECCTATASGLTAAPTAELGRSDHGWVLGRRERVWVARTSGVLSSPADVPAPDRPPTDVDLTVLDVGWDLGQVMASDGWINDQLAMAPTVIAVTTATIPGLRRLESALELLAPALVVVAVAGSNPRRWPRALTASLGPLTAAATMQRPVVVLAADKTLALRGLDSNPLPPSLLKAAQTLLQHAAAAGHHPKGPHE